MSARARTRRDFLRTTAAGAAGLLVLRVPLPATEQAPVAAGATGSAKPFEPNKWITIGADGRITLVTARSEMGQGARTALAMILAEELEADWRTVTLVHATPGAKYPGMRTSGSSSVSDYWRALRVAGAAAREMFREAAARTWTLPRAECRAENGSVVHAPSGKRLSYAELVAVAAGLPVPANPPLKDPKDYRLLGTRVRRVEAPAIVTGKAVYGLDARPEGALTACVVRCPVPGGKASSFDAAPARAIPGVRDVVQLSTGIAVVANDTWAALKGRDALKVVWDEGENRNDSTETYWKRLADTAPRARITRAVGDAEKALAATPASRRLDAEYLFSFQAHAPVEPMNCFADFRDGKCEIRVGTQAPNEAQTSAAKLLGVPPENVTVHVTLLGGGFGRRLDHDYVPEAVELARAIGKPVQVVWTRRDDFENDRFQPASIHRLAAGLDESNRVAAWSHLTTSFHLTMFGAYDPDNPEEYEGNSWGAFDNPYSIPALASVYGFAKSPVPSGAWRAVAYPGAVFARESFVDEVAHRIGADPVALRLDLLRSPELVRIGEGDVDRRRLAAVIRLAAEKSGWGRPVTVAGVAAAGRRMGRGIAANVYHGRTHMAQVAEVSVGPSGDVRVHRVVCASDCGQIINRLGVEAQVEGGIVWGLSAALKTEVTFQKGRVEQHSFTDYPVLRMSEMPAIEAFFIDSRQDPSGMGEQGVPCTAPAVANAIFAATGKRVRKLPIRLGAG
jgi:isoquinoline 1-oxidoreductase beta subunit